MPLSPDELEPFLRLALVQGVGPGRLGQLVDHFGTPDGVLRARGGELRALPGIGLELARRISAASGDAAGGAARRAVRHLVRMGATGLVPGDPLYPDTFAMVADPPYLVFIAGDSAALEREGVAVVGTRSPTPYGQNAARSLSHGLSMHGFSIVSGLARGIDTAAHEGALAAGGPTIGVLGHGIEQVYPPENRRLFAAVRERGLLISEYPPGETPKPGNFPRRNRLITALSEAVLVVEMGFQSGAQHTVNFALEQGREVLAVPGPIGSTPNAGTNQLIRDGARLVTTADEIVEEIRGVGQTRLPSGQSPDGAVGGRSPSSGADAPVSPSGPIDPAEQLVMSVLLREARHVDELATRTGLPTSGMLATLLDLELRGLVRALPGKRYCRA